MLHAMSAHPSTPGTTMADDWPMAGVMAGSSLASDRHAIDLARLFPAAGQDVPEIWVVETRRHLAGCINAVETGLRLALDRMPRVAAALQTLPDPLCWPTVQANPMLIEPALLAHMQMRAGISILLRQFGRGEMDGDDAADAIDLTADADGAVRESAIALALAEGRWSAPGFEDQSMRPDLPAEHFVTLVWTAAAPLFMALARSGVVGADNVIGSIEAAGRSLLSRHDEAAGAMAVADRLVRHLGERADDPELLGRALAQRRFLLFSALAARHSRLETPVLIDSLLCGPIGQVSVICHHLGGSAPDYRHLLLALRPVRPALTDAAILALADGYGGMAAADADEAIAYLRLPAALRMKLAPLQPMFAP